MSVSAPRPQQRRGHGARHRAAAVAPEAAEEEEEDAAAVENAPARETERDRSTRPGSMASSLTLLGAALPRARPLAAAVTTRIPPPPPCLALRCQAHSDVKASPALESKDVGISSQGWRIKMLYDGECPLCMRERCSPGWKDPGRVWRRSPSSVRGSAMTTDCSGYGEAALSSPHV